MEMKTGLLMIVVVALTCWFATAVWAQDPAQTDPSHFKVELDNPRVRVLRATLPPNTKVSVHELMDAVVVPLSDYESTLKRDGQTTTVERKTGKAVWLPGGVREFEAGAHGVNALLIEIKSAPPAK
jgi:hypothetical protein